MTCSCLRGIPDPFCPVDGKPARIPLHIRARATAVRALRNPVGIALALMLALFVCIPCTGILLGGGR